MLAQYKFRWLTYAAEGDGIGSSARVRSWAFRWYDWKHCG